MMIWVAIIIGILAGSLLAALSTLWINRKAEEETISAMSMLFATAIVKLRNELYWREYGLSQLECEEMHLPGDCPLCGAE